MIIVRFLEISLSEGKLNIGDQDFILDIDI